MQIEILQTNSKVRFPIVATIIKLVQRTKYSHYMIRVNVEGLTTYYDSTSAGVRKTNAEAFFKKHIVYRKFPVSKKISYIEFTNFFKEHEGKPYAFKQLIGLLLKSLRIVRHNPFGKGAKRIICNELVLLLLKKFYDLKIHDTDCYDLNDTYEILKKGI